MKNKTTENEDIYIGHLDPKYSWSHKAGELLAGKLDFNSQLIGRPNVDEVIKHTKCDNTLGVVPIYNSMNGDIEKYLRSLAKNLNHDVYIGDTIVVPIEQCLATKGDLEEICKIYSHIEALKQTEHQIKELEKELSHKIEVISCDSTAKAAEIAKNAPGTDIAAICSDSAAKANGLTAKKLTDGEANKSTFGVLGTASYWVDYYKNHPYDDRDNRTTALLVQPPKNYPGLLDDVIKPLRGEYDMLSLNSLDKEGPLKFYMEIGGSQTQELYSLLKYIKDKVHVNVKVLGNYPSISRTQKIDKTITPDINVPSVLW